MALSQRWLTISNMVTFLRILLVPFIVAGIVRGSWLPVFILLVAAAITDVLDGYLARWLNEQTALGACLDPIADKILLISSFSALAFIDSPSFSIPGWFVFLIVVREVALVGGAFFLYLRGAQVTIAPSIAGKLTTFFQLLFIFWLFVCYFVGWNPIKTYGVALVVLSLLSVFSFYHYVRVGITSFDRMQ